LCHWTIGLAFSRSIAVSTSVNLKKTEALLAGFPGDQ
jgi:hypothetical protein